MSRMAAPRSFLLAWRNAIASVEGPKEYIDRYVGLTMALYMSIDGLRCWPSQDTLALRTGLTDRTVGRAQKHLVDAKWLARKPRKGPTGARWGFEYRATLPRLLANAYANGERRSLFSGQDPHADPRRRPSRGNGESDDMRMANGVRTNSSVELVKNDASKKELEVPAEEIAEYEAAFGSLRPPETIQRTFSNVPRTLSVAAPADEPGAGQGRRYPGSRSPAAASGTGAVRRSTAKTKGPTLEDQRLATEMAEATRQPPGIAEASWPVFVAELREKDRHSHDEIRALFRWAIRDDSLRAMASSPAKLRYFWDDLQRRRASAATGTER